MMDKSPMPHIDWSLTLIGFIGDVVSTSIGLSFWKVYMIPRKKEKREYF